MENIVLEIRELTGNKCKKILREGKVPCVIYNAKGESKLCQIDRGNAERLLRGVTSSTMLDLEYNGKKIKTLVRDIDTHPRTDMLRHISFFELDEEAETTFEIPFALIGVAPAVKNNIGVLIQTTNSIFIKCKSKDLIPQIEVDISSLENIGDSILIKDIDIPKELKLINEEEELNYTVATITELQKQVEEKPEDEDEEGDGEGETTESEGTEEGSSDKEESGE